MSQAPHPHSQQGLTLVELMIAMTLGLIVIAALVAIFTTSNQNYRQNEAIATVQDNARFALDSLGRDLAMAGYWGGVRPVDAALNIRVSAAASSAVAKASAIGDCGPATQAAGYFWLFDIGTPLVFRNHQNNNTGSTAVNEDFSCLLPADVQADTDVLMVRRVSGSTALIDEGSGAVGALSSGRFYVKTNQNSGALFQAGSSFDRSGPADCPDSDGISAVCPPTSTPVQVYAYTPQIYYVRNYLRTAGDGLSILCRRYLDDTVAPATMKEDCLAEGVENLQIEWGIGATTVDNYLPNPSVAQLAMARTARIHIIVRATSKNVQASADAKTFTLADYTSPTQGGVLRRAFTTTVQLKNFQP